MIVERPSELLRERWRRRRRPSDPRLHLEAALAWIYRAQDATPDRGVSHSYALDKGWARSYPETTGYIIPTLLNWAAITGGEEPRRRALEMAEWELSVQLPDGGIPALSTGMPVVFDTGQVLFGWLAAFRETGDERHREAATKAADWLVGAMDSDGVWRHHGGPGSGPVVYNARTAWALVEAGRLLGNDLWVDRARAFLAWSLTQETSPGWFDRNCLNDFARPLLHTIAYTAQSQLEAGLLLGDVALVDAACRTATALGEAVSASGRMAGRFDSSWRPAAAWACLTGMAQTLLVWRRLEEVREERGHREAAQRVTTFLLSVHDVTSKNDALRGGVRGSYPIHGDYCRWRLPNWASKFLVDALFPSKTLTRHPG